MDAGERTRGRAATLRSTARLEFRALAAQIDGGSASCRPRNRAFQTRPAAPRDGRSARLRHDPQDDRHSRLSCRVRAATAKGGCSAAVRYCRVGWTARRCAATPPRPTPTAKRIASWRGPRSSPRPRRRCAAQTAGATGTASELTPHDGLVRPDHPASRRSSDASSRRVHCGRCCAIRSVSSGNTPSSSAAVNRRRSDHPRPPGIRRPRPCGARPSAHRSRSVTLGAKMGLGLPPRRSHE